MNDSEKFAQESAKRSESSPRKTVRERLKGFFDRKIKTRYVELRQRIRTKRVAFREKRKAFFEARKIRFRERKERIKNAFSRRFHRGATHESDGRLVIQVEKLRMREYALVPVVKEVRAIRKEVAKVPTSPSSEVNAPKLPVKYKYVEDREIAKIETWLNAHTKWLDTVFRLLKYVPLPLRLILGILVTLAGVAMVVLPGPATVFIPLGLAIVTGKRETVITTARAMFRTIYAMTLESIWRFVKTGRFKEPIKEKSQTQS